MGRNGLGNEVTNMLGKSLYLVYLISPILMMVVYSESDRGVFMTFIGNMYLGIGNLLLSFVFAVLLYLLFEY